MVKAMLPTLHIVFNGASDLEKALARLGRTDRVIVFPENLAVGPINPPDPEIREGWRNLELRSAEPYEAYKEEIAAFWTAALSDQRHRVAWTSRRSVQDHTGFLEFVWRLGDSPCDLIDLTEAVVGEREVKGKLFPPRLAGSLGTLNAVHIVDNNFLGLVQPLTGEMRAEYRHQWQKLRTENAPLRTVSSDLEVVSAPITFFDELLFSFVQSEWRKTAFIIGSVFGTFWDDERSVANDDFLATRLQALANAGRIEAAGDLHRIRHSEVRLPSR
jgi:hypothetical protein